MSNADMESKRQYVRARKLEDKLLDRARILEVRSEIVMIAYALLDDECYDREDAARDLVKLIEPLGIIETVHCELENCMESFVAILNEKSLSR